MKRDADQQEWLTTKFPEFLDHQAKKTTSTFFPSLYREYFEKWPPVSTGEDISEAGGDALVADAKVRRAEEGVSDFELWMLTSSKLIVIVNRGFTVGCTTAPVRSTVRRVRGPLRA